MSGNGPQWDERSQFRTWGTAYTGAEYYQPAIVNSEQPTARKLWSYIGLFLVYALWGSVIFEVGFYVGRWYEACP